MKLTIREITGLAAVAAIALGSAGVAQAQHGADDPVPHVHHQAQERHHHHAKHARAHHRHGADDGPNHR